MRIKYISNIDEYCVNFTSKKIKTEKINKASFAEEGIYCSNKKERFFLTYHEVIEISK